MTRETMAQEAEEAAGSLVALLEEVAHPGNSEGWDRCAYDRAVLAGHRALVLMNGTPEEQQARILARARALEAATVAAYKEEGFSDCDVCGKLATFTWERSDAYRKKHAGRKVKGNATPMLPVSWRCSTHVPVAFPELAENYRDARVVRVSETAVA